MDREKIIDHLQIIRIWAAVGKDPIYNGIEPKCCEDIEKWTKDALDLLKEQGETELCDRCGRRRLKSNRSIAK